MLPAENDPNEPSMVYLVDFPLTLAGRRFEAGDLLVLRPTYPEPGRRVVVEVGLPDEALTELAARDEFARALTPLHVASAGPPLPGLSRRHDRRRPPLRLV